MRYFRRPLGSIPRLVQGVRAAFLKGGFGNGVRLTFIQDPIRGRERDQPRGINRGRTCRVLYDGIGLSIASRASVPNLDQDTFDRLARDAERNCPVSRVLKTEITLDAHLVF
jgi:uncharacterized OsmC-like protein